MTRFTQPYSSISSLPLMYRRLFRKDNELREWECRIFTYPITVWISPMKVSSSEAILTVKSRYRKQIGTEIIPRSPLQLNQMKLNAIEHHFKNWQLEIGHDWIDLGRAEYKGTPHNSVYIFWKRGIQNYALLKANHWHKLSNTSKWRQICRVRPY